MGPVPSGIVTWGKGKKCRVADEAGNIYYARRRVNENFLAALHTEFLENGARILRRAGEENPATFLKVLAQLVPRELQVEHAGSIIRNLSDEQLAAMIAALDVQIQDALTKEAAEIGRASCRERA